MRLCFVLLPDPRPLAATSFEKALKEFPELGPVTWLSSTREGTSAFSVGGINVLCALMPMAVPEGEADGATEHSLSGLDGSWTLPDHRAHLVVVQQETPERPENRSAGGSRGTRRETGPQRSGDLAEPERPGKKGTQLEELTTFTRVVAGVVRATQAVGVYWGEGGATHHPEFVVNIAHSELPLPIWIGVSVAKAGKASELLSIGMKQLGLPELLLTAPAVDGGVFEFFYDLLAYVVRRGKRLPEGDSVGRTEKERLKVHYVASPVDADDWVWSVSLPPAKKTKKKPVKKVAKQKVAKKKKRK
ncbi:MAG: DUF4261 domain-containing protein [Archangium sp.]|nr:DUF4261 domain-containing protein [Archangium sp.]